MIPFLEMATLWGSAVKAPDIVLVVVWTVAPE
jgi:hypothetical protein